MGNDVTDSAIMKSISKPNGGIDRVQVFLALVLLSILLITCPAIILIVYWVEIDDNPPATVNNVHLHPKEGTEEIVDTAVVIPGGNLYFGMDYCKFTSSPAAIRRTWADDLLFISPPAYPSVLPRGCRHVDAAVLVPETLPTGEYTLGYTLEYQVNPLRERRVKFEVGPIKVQILP